MKNIIQKNIIYIILLIITCNTCYANDIINNNFLNKNIFINILIPLAFCICYILIIFENKIKIKKSTISIIFASIMWITIAYTFQEKNQNHIINIKIQEILMKYCELFLFLFTVIIYINLIKKLGILEILKNKILPENISYAKLYWITGFLAFFISPIADNLTTALLVCSIITSIAKDDKNFINISSINIVIAANAGGVFSPFGDITTLMIWQNNLVNLTSFIKIFFPAFINFIIPSIIISYKITNEKIKIEKTPLQLKTKEIIVLLLFSITIISTIIIQVFLKISPSIGMILGFSLLNIFERINNKNNKVKFFIYKETKNIDWDTLLFFCGIMLCVGAISTIGLLDKLSSIIYNNIIDNQKYNYIIANTLIGIISAIIDNIPITLAIIEMNINMSEGQWLLITLTTGTGGSLTSIGSAAGVALMGYTNGKYTFLSHLKWTWAILIGYITSIALHIIINNDML